MNEGNVSVDAANVTWPIDCFSSQQYLLEVSPANARIIQNENNQVEELEIDIISNASNSMSMNRRPATKEDFSRGNVENVPFLPGKTLSKIINK